MKKWKQALALVLALVMALSLVALPSFAEGEETGGGTAATEGSTNTPGLELRKVYNPSTGLLTLEAYATGSTTTTTSTEPVDIILVLDVSGSMDDKIVSYTYTPVYEINSNGTYFYQDANGQYQQAHHCGGGLTHDDGWFTKSHEIFNHGGTRLTPKTSADSTGTQFYTRTQSDTKKIDALKSAVNGFIDSVNERAPASRIALVKFAGEINNTIGNDKYKFSASGYNTATINYTQIVKGLTAASSASELKGAVNSLTAAGFTPAHLGMQLAKKIIDEDTVTDRQKVVVMFTDGEPNGMNGKYGDFVEDAANTAISNSKAIKDKGATVFTIGCFNKTYTDTSDVGKYMNRVSSNYPDATTMNNGTRGSGNYYKTVGRTADLDAIFQEISQTAGGATLTLGSETVLRDVVSEYFDLPENAAANITAKSYSCTALDADGAPIWNETPDQGTNYTVSIQDKTISVTGFDYSENWVGKDVNTGVVHPGKKLVVTITIQDNGTGMGTVPTNGTDSAVYDKDDNPVCPFAQPTAYFPYFTVVHRQSAVDDAGKNYGTDGGSTKHRVPTNGAKFDLTSVVTENYLYGGSFTDESCNTVQPYGNGENPMAFTPVDQATYYIWEVPNTYLVPRNYYVWRHLPENGGKETVVRLYPLTTADRTLYKQVGFVIDSTDYVSGCGEFGMALNNAPTLYQTAVAMKNGQHYQTVYLRNGTIQATNTAIENEMVNGQHIDEGCLAGIRLNDAEFAKFKSSTGVTFQPYWITLDGVKVYGTTARTCTYVDGQQMPNFTDSSNSISPRYVGTASGTAAHTMRLQPALLMSDADQQPPVVDQRLTVTVVDGSNTIEVKVAPNGSVRNQVAYQAPAGKVFAGWFADQAYTIPADLDQVTEDTTIYAKYVSDSYLDLHYARNGLFRLRGVTLISAVDNPANYQESGIIVDGEKLPVAYAARYRLFYTASGLFGAARNARLMITQQSLSGSGTLEVTPYWVTKDGTTVLGQPHTLHYSARGIWE